MAAVITHFLHSLPPPPRPVPVLSTVRAMGYQLVSSLVAIVGGLLLLIGIVGGALLLARWRRDVRLWREGIATPATVTGTYSTMQRDGLTQRRAYEVEYRFLLPSGRSWTGLQEVSLDAWNHLRAGDPLIVRYEAGNPARNTPLLTQRLNWLLRLFVGLTAVLVALGGSLLCFSAVQVAEPFRLYRNGTVTTGRILELTHGPNDFVSSLRGMRVVYEFRDARGGEFQGASATLDREFLLTVSQGSAVTVLYDSLQPTRNVLFTGTNLGGSVPLSDLSRGGARHV